MEPANWGQLPTSPLLCTETLGIGRPSSAPPRRQLLCSPAPQPPPTFGHLPSSQSPSPAGSVQQLPSVLPPLPGPAAQAGYPGAAVSPRGSLEHGWPGHCSGALSWGGGAGPGPFPGSPLGGTGKSSGSDPSLGLRGRRSPVGIQGCRRPLSASPWAPLWLQNQALPQTSTHKPRPAALSLGTGYGHSLSLVPQALVQHKHPHALAHTASYIWTQCLPVPHRPVPRKAPESHCIWEANPTPPYIPPSGQN